MHRHKDDATLLSSLACTVQKNAQCELTLASYTCLSARSVRHVGALLLIGVWRR